MKFGTKLTVGLLALAVVASVGLYKVHAQDTNVVTLTGNTIPATRNLTEFQDQSKYPHPGDRLGYAYRVYDFATDGGAVSAISLERKIQGNLYNGIPSNAIVVGGYLQIVTPMTPSGVTNSIGFNAAAANIIASSATNLTRAAGIYPLAITGIDTAVQASSNTPVILTMSGTTAATAGHFAVFLDLRQGQ